MIPCKNPSFRDVFGAELDDAVKAAIAAAERRGRGVEVLKPRRPRMAVTVDGRPYDADTGELWWHR